MCLYPDAEANSKELIGTHLRPGPVSKLLPVVHGQQRSVLSAVVGRTGALQEGFLLTQPAGQHGQQGHHGVQTCHIDRRESVFHSEMPTNKYPRFRLKALIAPSVDSRAERSYQDGSFTDSQSGVGTNSWRPGERSVVSMMFSDKVSWF